jgi:hypothetical protein
LIVIPRVLTDLLREIEGLHGKIVSLAFAERALQSCLDVLSPAHLDLSLAYIAAARDYIDGNSDIAALADARAEYFAGRDGGDALSERVMWVAAIAVAASCQREMERAGIVVEQSYVPDLAAVAKEAQIIVGSCAAAKYHDSAGDQVSTIAQRTRWAEARWQLIHLIATAPIPGD